MKLQIDSKDQIVEAETDSRGRITLGTKYADQTVQLAILEEDLDGDDEDA